MNGVVWLTAAVIATVFAWTFRLAVARGTNLLLALVLTLLAMSASMIHFLARPHVLSWLFTLAWFWILDSTEQSGVRGRRARWLWALPPSMMLWVNVHGGFLLGFVLLGIYWLGAFWTWVTTRETCLEDSLEKIASGRRVRQLTGVGLLSIAASFINPYGWKLHAHIYSYLSNRFLMDHIEEFQSPNFHGIAQKCFLALLLIAIAALATRGRKLRLSEILIAAVCGLCRAVCLAEHSRLFDLAGSDRRAAAAFARVLGLRAEDERRRFATARAPLANLRDAGGYF